MEANKEKKCVNFNPREYQIEVLEKALKENTIIFLPTGSGKTYIASMVIKHKSKDIERKYSEGGKRTFFLVNTVTLAHQQAESIGRQLPFNIGRYTGDMGVDYWNMDKWQNELEENEILVMTAQIFLDMLRHSYITLDRVNLLVLDECHHAVNKHAMRLIMEMFENVPNKSRPHILGLTATLLNGNVKTGRIPEEVHNLEVSLHSKICRAQNEEMLRVFSTNPQEEVIYFDLPQGDWHTKCLSVIDHLTKYVLFHSEKVYIEEFLPDVKGPRGANLLIEKKSEFRKLKNMMIEITEIANDLGPYAANYALLSRIITLERLKLSCSQPDLYNLYCMIITEIHMSRKKLQMIMSGHDKELQPFTYCTPKMKALFKIFYDFSKSTVALVFVTRRITAKVLYYVFEDIRKMDSKFKNIMPDFIVGSASNPYNDTREMVLKRRKAKEVIKKFNDLKETNVLFASDVVEEGIDVQHCNYVVKFDNPNTICSYIQSKGRARHQNSKYIILAPRRSGNKDFSQLYVEYQKAERMLTDMLSHGKDKFRQGGTEAEAHELLYAKEIEPFYTAGPTSPRVTAESAIALLNRYCGMLPQDKFTSLTVTYWKQMVGDKVMVMLRLPSNSPLKTIIKGLPQKNTALAKASAALEACKLLYKLGEFDQSLLPIGHKMEVNEALLFPLWDEAEKNEKKGEKSLFKPGTKKRKRIYDKKFPKWMIECTPRIGRPTYFHLIRITPNYECPSTPRHLMFYELLKSSQNFAILSSNPWPEVCEFPLFMNVGEVHVSVHINCHQEVFSAGQLKAIFDFHCLLFTEALPMKKKFLVKNTEDGENSYYIVPVVEKYKTLKVDWETIKHHKSIPEAKHVPVENRDGVVTRDKYFGKVVVPWYRPKGFTLRYIVTQVCEDQDPLSPFPSDNFTSYAHYFSQRYNEKIVHVHQPLLEVRAISSKMNCLLPKGKSRHGKKKRRDEDDLEEILVPELCTLIEFPSVYLLKVTLLPSVMHRITYLLLAEELRQKVANKVGLGKMILPKEFKWDPLDIDRTYDVEEPLSHHKSTIPVSNKLANTINSLYPRDCPWDVNEEPCDIERNIKTVDLLSIIYYDKFAKKKLNSEDNINMEYKKLPENVKVPEISLLNKNIKSLGPQLQELVQAIISDSASDVMNYERLETLGDSFLKFITSLVLFIYYPDKDEGKLTYIKGKIIGNKNLFYCGRHIKLGSIIKVTDFVPDDWEIPHYSVIPSIKQLLRETGITPSILYQLNLTIEERESGLLHEKTREQLLELLSNSDDIEDASRTSISLISQHEVSDKTIADSVEALIGTYLKACGTEGAMLLCKWLQVIPESLSDVKTVLFDKSPSALSNPEADVNSLLIMPEKLEEALGYKFKDRSFLLQALSHSTYSHYATDCYQRLEFLGDAILDFLITSHIYEKHSHMRPGDLTDCRSALVNNITFACLTVRYGFHKFVLQRTLKLIDSVNKFVSHQEKQQHKIGDEVLFLVNEDDVQIGEGIDIPKMLGDIFESLAGAVYLDSGKNLSIVWKVFYRLMHKEIDEFTKNIPKNHIRLLFEKFPTPRPTFEKPVLVNNGKSILIHLYVTHNGETKSFHGVGDSKSQAKLAAAKVALRYYHEKGQK